MQVIRAVGQVQFIFAIAELSATWSSYHRVRAIQGGNLTSFTLDVA
ncbi:MAG: hypothetical protein QMB25_01400 [Pseudomonadales bacterium]